MKKNKVLIGSALALLIAPTVLSNLSPQSVSAADTAEVGGLVGTVTGSGVLVNDQGQTITSTFLPNNSAWKLGNTKQINGVTYYQVATNEWIAANNLNISSQTQAAQTQSQVQTSSYETQVANSGQIGTVKWATAVVNSQGQAVSGVILPAGSSWNVGQTVTLNGESYVQIATDEYVAASNLNIATPQAATQTETQQTQQSEQQQPVVGTVVNGPADVYDTSMDSFSGRQLQEGSQWKVGQQVQNKYGYTFYQVSTNEWTQSSNMQVNQADQNVTSEPEFATSVTQ
ncbi:SLAP domain-containing protein [Companilactobacillus huachuanensis]|uniref:SLAP domain-containing protein n=1 Tax=Companilactobacillus huachuanensis TaxID=2559914 RepID=A0ABW1RK97_9LACO|nr:SLAP domain-containing protein [Companilactobacillus huachuanensis]